MEKEVVKKLLRWINEKAENKQVNKNKENVGIKHGVIGLLICSMDRNSLKI